jgi:hypothetical protein
VSEAREARRASISTARRVARALLPFHGASLPPMKILVTNYGLNRYAGTETFIYALSVELRRIGHGSVRWRSAWPRPGSR